MMSFAHAFYILLSPKMPYSLDKRIINDDPNNPWNLVTTYQVFGENSTDDANTLIIQPPDDNTNMFTGYITSVIAMSAFLTGMIYFFLI